MTDRTLIPVACTLPAGDVGDRVEEWRRMMGHARPGTVDEVVDVDGSVRLRVEMADSTPVAALAELVVAERSCCSFLDFAVTVDGRGLGLEVTAPADGAGLVRELLGGDTERA